MKVKTLQYPPSSSVNFAVAISNNAEYDSIASVSRDHIWKPSLPFQGSIELGPSGAKMVAAVIDITHAVYGHIARKVHTVQIFL